MDDYVDQPVFLQEFRGLEAFGQVLMSRLLDHAWTGKADHTFGFGNDDIA